MIARAAVLAFLALPLIGCSEPTAPEPAALLGRWLDGPHPSHHSRGTQVFEYGHYEFGLEFLEGGSFVFEARSFGGTPERGTPEDELTSWSRISGTFVVTDDRIRFEPDSLVTWDSFYDPPLTTVESPYGGTIYDETTWTVIGDVLVLHYLTYPADAPVETTAFFRRR
ncbi:MAG: hypothetical protein ACRELU_08900 [Gemmatimonadota bacterium]